MLRARRSAAATTLVVALGCGPSRPTMPAPEIVDQRATFGSLSKRFGPIELVASWVVRDGRHCVSGEDVGVRTPAGEITLGNADVCIRQSPPSVTGTADVPLPALGFLSRAGVTGSPPRAEISLALGADLGSIELGDEELDAVPELYYLVAHYRTGHSFTVGDATLSSPDASDSKMVLSLQEGIFYLQGSLGGAFAGELTKGIDDAAFGLAASGRLPFTGRAQVWDGSRWAKPEVTGHLMVQGQVALAQYPVILDGRVMIDADASDDGRTIFEGDSRDLVLAGDLVTRVGYELHGFDMTLEMSRASLLYDARPMPAGALYFTAESDPSVFRGTPLEAIEPRRGTSFSAQFRAPDDFGIYARMESRIAGFQISETLLELDNRGVRASGELKLPGIGSAKVEGSIGADGQVALTGRAHLTVAGFEMANAEVTLSNRGARVAGTIDIPKVGSVRISGEVNADGSFALTGKGTLEPAGLRMADAAVTVKPKGAHIAGMIDFFTIGCEVAGDATPKKLELSGSARIDLALIRGEVSLTVGTRRFRAFVEGEACLPVKAGKRPCVKLAGMEVDTKGRVCPIFPIAGKKCIPLK